MFKEILKNVTFHLKEFSANAVLLFGIMTRFQLENKNVSVLLNVICDALHDYVPFVQFRKLKKYPWKSVTFSKVTFSKVFTFLKLYKWYQTTQRIT